MLFAVGGGLRVAAGVEVSLTDRHDDRKALQVVPAVRPGGAGVAMSGTF